MKRIPLTNSKEKVLVNDKDFARVSSLKWFVFGRAGTIKMTGRIEGQQDVLANFILGNPPEGYLWDHKNRNGFDNTRKNLRLATCSQNSMNRKTRSDNLSGYKGVYWHTTGRRWRAEICARKKNRHLGFFDSATEAAKAYDEAARKYHGEFASVNFK